MFCPICGNVIGGDRDFCSKCGFQLSMIFKSHNEDSRSQGNKMRPYTSKCRNCGKVSDSRTHFCPYCGMMKMDLSPEERIEWERRVNRFEKDPVQYLVNDWNRMDDFEKHPKAKRKASKNIGLAMSILVALIILTVIAIALKAGIWSWPF